MSADARKFANELDELRRQVRGLSLSAQLGDSSIEDGSTYVYDADGTLRQIIGAQVDGSYTAVDFNGTAPVAPADPTLAVQPGLLIASSYGLTSDLTEWPLDFLRIDLHVGTTAGFVPSAATKVAEFTADGGSITLALDPGTYYAVLVAVNSSGIQSVPSGEVSAAVSAPATGAGGVATYLADTAPVGLDAADDGAIWYDTSNGNLPSRWDGTTLEWVPMQVGTGAIADGSIGLRHLTAAGVNVLANPGFEGTGGNPNSLPHFINPVGQFYGFSATPFSGDWSLRVAPDADIVADYTTVIANGYFDDVDAHAKAQPGETWRFRFFARSEDAISNLTIKSGLQTCDSSGTVVLEELTAASAVLDDQWTEFTVDLAIPTTQSNAFYVVPNIRIATATLGDALLIDTMSLIRLSDGHMLTFDALNGKEIIGASIKTAESGTRIELIGPDGPFGELGMLAFYSDEPGWEPGIAWGKYDSTFSYGEFGIQGPYPDADPRPIQMSMRFWSTGERQIVMNADELIANGEIIVNTGLRIGDAAQRLVGGLDFGNKTNGTTDANGDIDVAHGLGATPTVVLITNNSLGQRIFRVQDKNATTFRVRVFNDAGVAQNGANVDFGWLAIGGAGAV